MSRELLQQAAGTEEEEEDSDPEEGASLLGRSSTDGEGDYDEDSGYIANDGKFKAVSILAILLNAMCMAAQVDYPEARPLIFGHRVRLWLVLGALFNIFFVAEISLSIHANGIKGYFCCPDEWSWNVFDFVVVFGGLAGFAATEVFDIDSEAPAALQRRNSFTYGHGLMLLRMLRVLRVLRVVRIFRAFRQLRMLARGLLESMRIVFWIFVLMLLVIFLSAIVCTTIIGQDSAFEGDEEIHKYFGSVGRSMFTLFQFLTMDDWAAVEKLVFEKQEFMRPFFFAFIFFGAFVLMSLLTGVMADHMNDVRQQEEEEEHREKIHQREHTIKLAKSVDINGDGALDRTEFRRLLAHPLVARDMHSVGVSLRPREARDLFEWFDVNGDGLIDNEELYHGLKHLFEGVTGLQMYKLKVAVKRACALAECPDQPLHLRVAQRPPPTEKAKTELTALAGTVEALEANMDIFEDKVRRLMATFGYPQDKDGCDSPRSSRGSPTPGGGAPLAAKA